MRYSSTTFCRSSAFQSWVPAERGVVEGGALEEDVVDGLAAGAGWTRCIPPVIVGPGIGQ